MKTWVLGCTILLSTFSFSAFLTLSAAASAPEICIGKENSKKNFIYLHGMDTADLSNQELNNRNVLKTLAKDLGLRIALPRSDQPCPNVGNASLLCWGWKFDQVEVQKMLPKIISAAKACFSDTRVFNVLGFSNGGYFANAWFLYADEWSSAVSGNFFSVGSDFGRIQNIPKDRNSSPIKRVLTLVIGKQDEFNRDPNHEFFQSLIAANIPAKLVEFEGGHELILEPVKQSIQEALVE